MDGDLFLVLCDGAPTQADIKQALYYASPLFFIVIHGRAPLCETDCLDDSCVSAVAKKKGLPHNQRAMLRT
jgi:hypothetical protein